MIESTTIQKLTKQMRTLQFNLMESNQVLSNAEVLNSNINLGNTIKKHSPSFNNNSRYISAKIIETQSIVITVITITTIAKAENTISKTDTTISLNYIQTIEVRFWSNYYKQV
jgi:hypothetical protein